jgi:RNA polymerase sigma-70 factor, ECF subfamily
MQRMLKPVDDCELVSSALGGDRDAFRRLVERHYDMIYRVARRYLGSAADAEDVAQDVCVTLATRLAEFGGRSRFSTWVTSIAINRCRDSLRRRKSSQELSAQYVTKRELEDADHADSERRTAWLHEALQSLEPDLRETVLLIVAEEMSHAEAALALGCAEGTVSWRLHMAKKELRALMEAGDE